MKTLKEFAEAKRFSQVEKDFLISEAKRLNIAVNVKDGCSSCYRDLAVLIYNAEKFEADIKEALNNQNYILKKGVDVWFGGVGGVRVNSLTLTESIAKKMISAGLQKYFEKWI